MGSHHCIQCTFGDGLKLVSSGSWHNIEIHGLVSLWCVKNL
jgi:phage/plasmid primase-like uncharacterized protein